MTYPSVGETKNTRPVVGGVVPNKLPYLVIKILVLSFFYVGVIRILDGRR